MLRSKYTLGAICLSILLTACSGASPETDSTPVTAEKSETPVIEKVDPAAPQSFESQTPPPAPDYAQSTSWAVLPSNPGLGLSTPPNSPTANNAAKDVNVFYIHPTTYKTQTQWNQDVADEVANKWTNESVIARQATAFNACCEIYAPYYRQASFLATKDQGLQGDGGKAFDLAYSDVLRAFDEFIEAHNDGRPFILAGHSQGAEHSYRLLRDRIDGKPLKEKMVAAYVVGLDLAEGAFGQEYKDLEVCQTPNQTKCVVGWNAVNTDANLAFYKSFAGQRYVDKFGTEEGRSPVCINPLTFDASQPSGDKSKSLGAVSGTPGFGSMEKLIPNSVSAKCDSGFLVTDYADELGLEPLPGGSLHYHDFSLFYQNIKENAAERIAAFR